MSAEFTRGLQERLEANGATENGWSVERTLKETEDEVTELVRDASGKRWVRKLFCRDDPAIERSYRAIRQSASLYLPHIRALDHSAAGTVVVREFYAGPTLRQWAAEYGPFEEPQAREALLEICRGVQALHSCEPPLIHRDINPNNIIMTAKGPRLIDFGIARAYDERASRDTHAWGTTGYAAPEQFGFDQSDARTDVFALGMLFWFMLTGKDPEANLSARLRKQSQGTDAHGISAAVGKIIERCVALSPEARYANVEELMEALRERGADAGTEAHIGASPAATRRGSRIAKLLSACWLIVSSTFMAFLAFAIVFTLAEPWRLSVPAGWMHALAFCLGLLVMFAPTWLLSTDLFHIRERMSFLRGHTLVKCLVICIVSLVVGALVVGTATTDLPDDYVRLMQEHGQSSI